MVEFSEDRSMTVRLSKSGKAVMIYDEEGNAFMTSVFYMQKLLDGTTNRNLIKAKHMGGPATSNFQSKGGGWDQSKIQPISGNPLSYEANKSRESNRVKIKDDW